MNANFSSSQECMFISSLQIQVDSALAQNDYETAWSYSNTAKWLNIVGITIGAFLLAGILSFIIVYFTLLNPIGPDSHIRG